MTAKIAGIESKAKIRSQIQLQQEQKKGVAKFFFVYLYNKFPFMIFMRNREKFFECSDNKVILGSISVQSETYI